MTKSPKVSLVSETEPAGATVGQGRYVVVGSLGAGSQGETLEAVDKREGRAVALKRFTLRSARTWKEVELAEREATVLASLSHPCLPRYIEHFEEDGSLYLVMEKVEGESLAARRRRKVPFQAEQVLRFLRDCGECLRYLHGHTPPIVHRDIKPGNVILRPDGSHCLVDFGSVRDSLKPEGGSTVVGTFGFMAPEQFQGRAAPVSDVYAVGATALCLVTGRQPEDLPHKGLAIDVEGALRGQVDRRLIATLRSMLEPDPERRAASVDAALRLNGLGPGDARAESADAQGARRARLEAEGYWQRPAARSAREQRRHERDGRRREKHEAKRQRRHERHYGRGSWHRPGRTVPPGIVLGTLLLVALQVAGLATFALFHVLLPILFTLFPVPGRRARMLEIGQAGQRGLHTASQHIRYQFLGGPAPLGFDGPGDEPDRAQSHVDSRPRQRVSLDAEGRELDEQAAEAEAERAATSVEPRGRAP